MDPEMVLERCDEDCWLRGLDVNDSAGSPQPLQTARSPDFLQQNSHKYKLLKEGKIRNLCLHRSPRLDAPLEASLTEERLETAPPDDPALVVSDRPYEALSYVWGSSERTHHILLDGQRFAVTKNLASVLYQLRSTEQDRLIWIDSICINQDDVSERNYLVRQMTNIYRGALGVIVWLGTATENSQLALEAMNYIDQPAFRHYLF